MVNSITSSTTPATFDAAKLKERSLQPVNEAAKLVDGEFLTKREASLVFRLGGLATIVIADELGLDIRDSGYTDVMHLMSAQELNAFVLFTRNLLDKRTAGAA